MSTKHSLYNLTFFVLGATFMILYVFFRPQASGFWNSSVNKMDAFSTNAWNSSIGFFKNFNLPFMGDDEDKSEVAITEESKQQKTTKDCGVSVTADLNKATTYENNAVFNCLGDNARVCNPAKATLQDSYFPTNFEIIEHGEGCNFKLSYPANSTLTDTDGKKLANQYIMCPVSIVRSLKEDGNNAPSFGEPSKSNADKYAAEIYSYGTIGVFIENNLDEDKIEDQGCSGSYIKSIIRSYEEAESNN